MRCKHCGSESMNPILYGSNSPEAYRAATIGLLKLNGVGIGTGPLWYCNDCGRDGESKPLDAPGSEYSANVDKIVNSLQPLSDKRFRALTVESEWKRCYQLIVGKSTRLEMVADNGNTKTYIIFDKSRETVTLDGPPSHLFSMMLEYLSDRCGNTQILDASTICVSIASDKTGTLQIDIPDMVNHVALKVETLGPPT